jgi:hypothetical protein
MSGGSVSQATYHLPHATNITYHHGRHLRHERIFQEIHEGSEQVGRDKREEGPQCMVAGSG